jgi:signal transduction histidine kinase
VKERTEELARANAALRDADKRKDDFLATLAHELRNPLAPISAAADVLRRGQADAAQVKRTSEVVARQVRHLSGLVNDLLDVSRVTRGLVHIARRPEDLRAVVQDAAEQVRPLVDARGHLFSMELPHAPACVLGDRKRLVQIVTNLLANAAKYTPDGGEVDLRLDVLGQELRLQVEDNGIGIAPELRPHVFDLFVQGDRSTDRAQGGLGIGLALVKRLVELHDGIVHCESEGAGRGSLFTLRLPRLLEGGCT